MESTQELEFNRDTYREYPAINYSRLSALSKHPSKVNEEKDFSDGIQNGDLLDIICFDGEEAVHNKYHVSLMDKLPSDIIKQIIETTPDYHPETLVKHARSLGYGADNWKDDTILKKIYENNGEEYISLLEEANGKPIITFELFNQMKDAAIHLHTHSFTKNFFKNAQYQVPQKTTLAYGSEDKRGIEFKGLLDIKQSLPNNVLIISDLKYTSYPLTQFESQFLSWRYDLQGSLYHDIVQKENPDHKVESYYIVYSAFDNAVQAFKLSDHTLDMGRFGGTTKRGREIKGYKELTKELLWHMENDLWEYPYEVYINKGITIIDL